MNHASVQTIRKAAILVASLDEQQGRQLTDGLSANDADALRKAVADLGPIDPEEQLEVFQELRLGSSHASSLEAGLAQESGVELDWSPYTQDIHNAQDQNATELSNTYAAKKPRMPRSNPPNLNHLPPGSKPFSFFGSHDTQAMAKKLLDEPPQIIAVVMSQLTADLAADLLREMPLTLQAEVLERLALLHPADQQSLEAVEDHLADWIESHRQQQQRLSRGNEKVRQILVRTSAQQRKEILDRLGRQNQTFAQELEGPATSVSPQGSNQRFGFEPGAHPHKQETEPTTMMAKSRKIRGCQPSRLTEPALDHNGATSLNGPSEPRRLVPAVSTTGMSATPTDEPPEDLDACDMAALHQVSDAMLLEALRKTEPQIAMLALAGAPIDLLDRILGQLPRRQAKRFRHQLHSLQPTRIRDLLAAQQQFVQLALGGSRPQVE